MVLLPNLRFDLRSKLRCPRPDLFMRGDDPAFGEKALNIAKAKGEMMAGPDP